MRIKVLNVWAEEACETIWAACSDCALRVWGGAEGKALRFLKGHEDTITTMEGMGGIGGLQAGCLVGTGSSDRTVRIWDARAKRAQIFLFKGHSDTVLALRWGEGGRSVMSGGKDKTIRIWDTRAGRLRHAVEKHFGAVNTLRAVPEQLQCNALKGGEGASFVSAGRDSMVNLWTASGSCVGTQAAHRGSVNFLSDINCKLQYRPGLSGTPMMFSIGADSAVKIWDLKRFKIITDIQVPPSAASGAAAVAAAGGGSGPSAVTKGVWAGQSIVTGGSSGNLKLWDYTASSGGGASDSFSASDSSSLTGGKDTTTWVSRDLTAHTQTCTDLISTDRFVASASKSGQILRWER